MVRVKEEPAGRLAALQKLVSGGGQVLLDQAQTLQRTVAELGRGVEGQVSALIATLEERLSGQLDAILSSVTSTLRHEIARVSDRVHALETGVADRSGDGVRGALAVLEATTASTAERHGSLESRIDELAGRLQAIERRFAEMGRDANPEEADEVRARLLRLDQRASELAREFAGKLGDLTALRDRLTRMETRVLDASKDQIARASEVAGVRDRLARLESRLSDLSREQVARAVESAGLRERVFRLEQRAGSTPATTQADREPATPASDG